MNTMNKMMLSLVCACLTVSTALPGEVGFIEDFALARDRAVSLRQLIPGTEDYYYFHCLHLLNTEQYDKVGELIRPWLERFGQTARLTEIQTRHALLSYQNNPQRSLDYLRRRLGLRFDHQKEVVGAAPNLPTALDPKLTTRATLCAVSFARWQNLDNFEDTALDWLAAENLNWERRRNLLQRLTRPDLANLPQLIVEDLKARHPQEFGAYGIHRQLTLAQLDDLLRLQPSLLNQTALVQTWLTKLQPGADEDWKHDRRRTQAYLERLQGFVGKLDPVHNSLKAHVLYHRLALDRAQGVYDRVRFLAYLQLPRQQGYMAKDLLERDEARRYPADLNADFAGLTLLPPVGSDEELVRSYLKQFFLKIESTREFEPYINDVYLRHLFAETRIEQGVGDPEQWASQLPPELFRRLKERIDIDFAYTNKTDFAADEPVTLDLFVKNVPSLLVKVFQINTQNFYRTHQREIDTDINLDGLVANAEQTHTYTDPPLRRMARPFTFPALNKPGVYVIDFIGAGKSSRALIRKGQLHALVATGSAGQVITVVDDSHKPVKDATAWLGGQEYRPGQDGRITVPFSTAPGRRPLVLSRGDWACLDYMSHQAEDYRLAAGIHVDREALLTQRIASVLVRPGLFLNGTPVSLKLLEEVKLRITSTDHDNIATSTEVPSFRLFEDRESIHEFRVPSRLASLTIALHARVKNLSLNKPVELGASETFAVNGIDRTDKIEDLHLARFGADHVLEVLGRTGEPKPDRAVQLALKHRDFREPVRTTLKTDGRGRVLLGPLTEIVSVTAVGPEGTSHTWELPLDRYTYRQILHARAGEVITLPYLGSAEKPSREELALFEVRGDVIRADRFTALGIRNGLLELKGLLPGDYDLWLKSRGERIRIRVVQGPVVGNHVLGDLRELQLPPLKPVQIAAITAGADQLTVRLQDVSPFTRIHVFASRYQPAFSPFLDLARVRDAELQGVLPSHAESVYLTGRNIGDEYRYVLDRRSNKQYPGNMLERPMLLLNPWAVRSTETGEQLAEGGDHFRSKGAPTPSAPVPDSAPGEGKAPGRAARGDFANLDFLADASAVLVNLVPDKDGVIRILRKQIGPHAQVYVVAVDPLNTVCRSTSLAEENASFVDLRLRHGLDPKSRFTLQKQVSIVTAKEPFTLADLAGSRFETYDSLARVYSLYATLCKDAKLAEFAFILTWPKLKPEEKRTLFSKHASHELHFFLAKKDPAFFKEVVQPYLASKKDKTFLDHWLLGNDLAEYLQPWRFGRLNTVERVLLAQRIKDEPAKTQRYLDDLLRLQPPNPERFLMLFDTAVKSSALGTEDPYGLNKAKRRLQLDLLPGLQQAPAEKKPAEPAKETPRPVNGDPAAPPAPGAMDPRSGRVAGKAEKDMERLESRLGREPEEMKKLQQQVGGLAADKSQPFFEDGRERLSVRQLYRRMDPTQEWAENNYYHLPIQQQLADLVTVNPFWLDYARHDGKSPFLSKHLAEASHNFTEILFALAVLDLPFESAKHKVDIAAGRMTLTVTSPVVAFHEEVRQAEAGGGQVPILVSQNFYKNGERYREENGEKIDKFVTGEFLAGTVYGCQVVVTNPTSSRQKLNVLIQVPVGAIPVGNGQNTRTVLVDLEPYRTQTIDYLFYFPLPGRFAHFPVNVARNERFLAAGQATVLDVVAKLTKLDTSSWDFVSQNGSSDDVLAFLKGENVFRINLDRIAFRMRERAFFTQVLAVLQNRHAYSSTLWSYGIFHADVPSTRHYLLHADTLVAECGGPLVSPLLIIDPVARYQYEHLEYRPLVNARVHALGQRRQIVNGRLLEQYQRFLKLLSYRRQLDDTDKLAVTYYLLLQDRVEEALAAFAEVNADRVATKIQHDYCAAYLALFENKVQQSRAIAARYTNHPVDRWRKTFAALVNQLDEAEDREGKVADVDDRGQRQGQLAATEPAFELTLDAKAINLSWQKLEAVRVNYYLMDVELLFSRNPFVQQVSGPFASIRPNATQEVKLPAGKNRLSIPLPPEYTRRNVLVEVAAAGKTQALPFYANAMDVRLMENFGQLRVTEAAGGKPLSKVYVKVYVRLAGGQVKFHKDGYTDLRGRFDYASVSTPERLPPERFAILILSDERGALIREAAPPQQ
jgi:hypothetical protein